MNTQHNMEERLWDFIDGISSAEEKTVIERLLETDAAWKAKYGELMEVHGLVKSAELEAPSMRFTKNVMEEIARMQIAPATKSYINKKIIAGIWFAFIAIIACFFIYGIMQINWTSSGSSNITIGNKLDKVDFGRFFNNTIVNIFMMVNVLLGLVLLDNYLNNKRKAFRKEA
jgi:hypothetical protein